MKVNSFIIYEKAIPAAKILGSKYLKKCFGVFFLKKISNHDLRYKGLGIKNKLGYREGEKNIFWPLRPSESML